MDIVERLRELSTEERRKHKSAPDIAMFDAANEIERLRQQNAELVDALETISEWQPNSATQPRQKIIDNMRLYASLSVAKATGGE